MNERAILTVTELNSQIKRVINERDEFRFIKVKGEISNFKKYSSGHIYFSIKDEKSIISCVLFASYASKVNYELKDGDEVVVLASLDVYTNRGTYQLCVYEIEPLGLGNQLVEFEKLKRKLQGEGLFDTSKKRNIIKFPNSIGIITAINGAAIKDLLFNIQRRYPLVNIYIFPSAVQGESAPKELLKAFNKAQEYPLDTLIIGRGGGAKEDLSAFNDEKLVRAIANSKMPVIAAVGHEIDFTLVDYVADKRVSTPTAAAEIATPDQEELLEYFEQVEDRLKSILRQNISKLIEEINDLNEELDDIICDNIEQKKVQIDSLSRHLKALSPKKILERGYSISTNISGKVIKSVKDANIGDEIITTVSDGNIISVIKGGKKRG